MFDIKINTALAIPWMLSLGLLLAFLVPWLGTGGEFFDFSERIKASRSELTTPSVSHERDTFYCKF